MKNLFDFDYYILLLIIVFIVFIVKYLKKNKAINL